MLLPPEEWLERLPPTEEWLLPKERDGALLLLLPMEREGALLLLPPMEREGALLLLPLCELPKFLEPPKFP